MRVYYFPDWVFSALSAQGKNRSDVLCDEIVTSILSLDDVAFVSVMNLRLSEVLPKSIIETFLEGGGGPSTFWPKGEFGGPGRYGAPAQKPTPLPGFWDRFQNIMANGVPEPWAPGMGNLDCEMMDEDTIVFTNKRPVDKNSRDGIAVATYEQKLALLERVIEVIYPFVTFEDLVQTPLMRDYLAQVPLLLAAA